jgi:hypothetical protein
MAHQIERIVRYGGLCFQLVPHQHITTITIDPLKLRLTCVHKSYFVFVFVFPTRGANSGFCAPDEAMPCHRRRNYLFEEAIQEIREEVTVNSECSAGHRMGSCFASYLSRRRRTAAAFATTQDVSLVTDRPDVD